MLAVSTVEKQIEEARKEGLEVSIYQWTVAPQYRNYRREQNYRLVGSTTMGTLPDIRDKNITETHYITESYDGEEYNELAIFIE